MVQIERFEGPRAQNYEAGIRTWFPAYDTMLGLIEPVLTSQLPSSERVSILCVGSGTGTELKLLAEAQPNWEITGVDPSPLMNEQARHKTASLSNVSIYEGTITDISGQFDAITTLLVAHFFPLAAKRHLFQEVYSHLKPGGILISADMTKEPSETGLEAFKQYQRPLLDEESFAGGFRHIEQNLHRISDDEHHHLWTNLGFSRVELIFQWLVFKVWLVRK